MEPSIKCPNCQTEIKLTETLAAPLTEKLRKEHEKALQQKEKEFAARDLALKQLQAELAQKRELLDEEVQAKLKAERQRIASEELKKARASFALDLEEKAKQLEEARIREEAQKAKLAEAQKVQAEFLKKERDLEDARREIELTIQKKVIETQAEIKAKAKLEAETELSLKVQEREKTIQAMQRQIEELKRKSEQGSQQLQGEVLELQLEASLRANFPHDQIQPVPKGEFGGDTIQAVFSAGGVPCGKILWETKRTKNWSDGWLAKLKDDQRAAGAEAAIIVSHSLPKTITTFGQVEGIWITSPSCFVPVALAVRQMLIEVAGARRSSEGQLGKMEVMYQYLTGPRFRHRVEAIVEKFQLMHEDLERERRTMQKLWARREAQIRGAMESTSGMYGDMQGIAGRSMQEIRGLDWDESFLLEAEADSPRQSTKLLESSSE